MIYTRFHKEWTMITKMSKVFNPEQENLKSFLEISIFDQLKTVNSETISNLNEIRNCNSAFKSEQYYVIYIPKDLCI